MTRSADALSKISSHYTNFLEQDDTYFISSSGSWTATNASLVVENTRLFRGFYKTLSVQALSSGSPFTDVEITHEPFLVSAEYLGDSIDATAFFFASTPVEIAVKIENSISQSITTEYFFVPASTWTLIKSDTLPVPTNVVNQTFSATFYIRSSSGLFNFLFAHPVAKNAYGFADNLFLRETIARMPRFLIDLDAEQSRPKYPMTRFIDVGLAYADRAFRQALDFRYRDISEGYIESDDSTKSTLVDPSIVDADYLPWLAQFVGIKLDRLASGTTPWRNLPSSWEGFHEDIDPAADITYSISSISRDGSGTVTAVVSTSPTEINIGDTVTIEGASTFNGQFELTDVDTGTNTLTWSQDGSAVSGSTGTVTLVDTEWIEIETLDTTDANYIPSRRELVEDRRTGYDSGTCKSIRDAIRYLLTGTKTIDVSFDPIQNPWKIYIKTLTSETPSGVTGQESALLLSELNKVRPMGFKIYHECVSSL
jgi:hypothetical protein